MRKRRISRRFLFRLNLVAASAVTLLFLLSTIFSFGVSTHRDPSLSWYMSRSGVDLAQIWCGRGQFHLTFLFDPPPTRFPQPLPQPRRWYAGVRYLPIITPSLRITDRWTSKCGVDVFIEGRRAYFGIFTLYPAMLLWTTAWLLARRKEPKAGRCPTCNYDLRGTPQRCPECGTPVVASERVPAATSP